MYINILQREVTSPVFNIGDIARGRRNKRNDNNPFKVRKAYQNKISGS